MWNLVGRLGRLVLDPVREGIAVLDLLGACAKSPLLERRRGIGLVRRTVGAQLYFTAVQPLPLFLMLGLVSGWVLWLAVELLLERVANGALMDLAPQVGVMLLARELGPLIVALVLIARSATAVSTELGYMKVMREIEAIEAQGMNVEYLVVLPRVLGIAASAAILSVVFAMAAIPGGFFLAQLSTEVNTLTETHVTEAFGPRIWSWMVIKATVFGTLLATIACHHGLRVRSSFTEIPRANVRTAVQCLALCFLANAALTLAEILW
ncbi:MAG: ABC transporter permease [Planctomycetes bacterium]|nr:ABC transporter permease [Planctomycetota bacterium]